LISVSKNKTPHPNFNQLTSKVLVYVFGINYNFGLVKVMQN